MTTYDTEGLPSIPSGLPGNVYDHRERTLWRLAKIRASDLRCYDIIHRPLGNGPTWIEVLDVYFDVRDPDELAEQYEKYDPALAKKIRELLDTNFNLHVLVRYINVAKSDGNMLEDDFMWLLAAELVDVQVPEAVQLGRAAPERT